MSQMIRVAAAPRLKKHIPEEGFIHLKSQAGNEGKPGENEKCTTDQGNKVAAPPGQLFGEIFAVQFRQILASATDKRLRASKSPVVRRPKMARRLLGHDLVRTSLGENRTDEMALRSGPEG
jgi:hypothetical protein